MRVGRRSAMTALAACIGASLSPTFGDLRDRRIELWQTALGETTMTTDGLKTLPSFLGAKESMDQLESNVKSKGLTVFARIDHAAAATAVGMNLRPTEPIIFGNARGGTPLMQADQRLGIELPLKALVYQDDAGKVWVSYVDLHWLARRYALGPTASANVDALGKALEGLVSSAITAP
jgi:uncharacterized protein (DUF302 family)